jgi:hypothetical protein
MFYNLKQVLKRLNRSIERLQSTNDERRKQQRRIRRYILLLIFSIFLSLFYFQGITPTNLKTKAMTSTSAVGESRTEKYRYGAWYLPKNLWQHSLTTDELRDPKAIKAERDDTTRKREEEIV